MTTAVKLQRRADWPERLDAYVRQSALQTFAWGQHDCQLFAAGAVEAMTGEDLGKDLRGKYCGQISAAKFVRRTFGGDTEVALAKVMQSTGCDESAVGKARRGDVLLLDEPEGLTVGIVHPLGVYAVTVAREGIVLCPMSHAIRAWRVG